jgi:hypothetical protein
MTEWGSPKLRTWAFDYTANGGIHKAFMTSPLAEYNAESG